MFVRALAAFLICPGTVAFLVPLWLIRPDVPIASFRPLALVTLAAGVLLLLWCVREFYVAGQGTLAPWSPPRHLVDSGPYRRSRNPMYVAVLLILCAWALGFWSTALLAYALSLAVAFHLRVILGEEPWLARTHGEAWRQYRARVPRWVL